LDIAELLNFWDVDGQVEISEILLELRLKRSYKNRAKRKEQMMD
jgi:hypothetical protein